MPLVYLSTQNLTLLFRHVFEILCFHGHFFLVGDVESVKTNAVYTCIVLFLPFKRISLRGNKIVPNITQEVNSQHPSSDP